MQRPYKVYKWTNTANQKVYVGATRRTLEKRAGREGKYYVESPRFYAAIKKYGFRSFRGEILKDSLTREQAADFEKLYIKQYDSMNPDKGYNLTPGGFDDTVTDGRHKARFRKAMIKLNAQPEYKQHLREQLKAAWQDPIKRQAMLVHRTRTKAVFCVETRKLYSSITKACQELGIAVSSVTQRLREATTTTAQSRDNQEYTFVVVAK